MFASLAVMVALLVPMVGTASAALADDLECVPEQSQNATSAPHTIDCYVLNSADTGKTIRFERSGDADGFSPLTPDFTAPAGTSGVDAPAEAGDADVDLDDTRYTWATFTSTTAQTETITAWVDDDNDISTLDFDQAEGRDEAVTPGNVSPEPDETEVVEKTWFAAAPAFLKLDCDDESGDDTQTNPAGQSETYSCHAYSDTNDDDDQDIGEPDVSGLAIDAENLNGANDPDNSAATGTADFNNACTTDANGDCTFVLAPSEGQIGAADVCFWADVDNDNAFSTAAGIYDGFNCSEGVGAAENDNETDKVTKTWAAVGTVPAVLDAEPEVDNNPTNTQHTVSAVVVDQFGTPVPNQLVDFEITGASRNVALGVICDNVLTNASGTATCSYTDTGAAAAPGTDIIEVYEDSFGPDGEARETEDGDLSDTVTKYWTPGGPPAAAATVIDMNGTGASGGAADCTDTPVGADETVGGTRIICGDVLSSVPAGIPGASATFTTNLGFFTNAAGDDLGQSVTTTTDENGEAFALLSSVETGIATVTLTSGAASDSGTMEWTAEDARNIECSPETAVNPTGTKHLVTCVVFDLFGNPAPGWDITIGERGVGRIDATCDDVHTGLGAWDAGCVGTSDGNGQFEVIFETIPGEEGTQELFGAFPDHPATPEDDNTGEECDKDAGDPVGSEAGNCFVVFEKVWSDSPLVGEDHARTLHLNKSKHINLGGGKRSLKWSGLLSTDDGLAQCSASQQVKVQIRAGGSWITRKSDTTNSNGKFSVLIRDIAKKYRAVAPKSSFTDDDGAEQTCLRAVSNVRKHRHKSGGGGGGAQFYR